MEPKLKLIDHFLLRQSADVVQIRAQQKTLLLRGALVRQLLPHVIALLDGSFTKTEITNQLASHEQASELIGLFDVLQQKDLVESLTPCPVALKHLPAGKVAALSRFFANHSQSAWPTLSGLQQRKVVLCGQAELLIPLALGLSSLMVGRICLVSAPITALDIAHSRYLSDIDLGLHPAAVVRRQVGLAQQADIVAVEQVPDSVLSWRQLLQQQDLIITAYSKPIIFNSLLSELNQAVLLEGLRWLPLAVIENKELQLGPAVIPGQTACYQCFEYRLRANLSHLEHYDAFATAFNSLQQLPDFGVLPPFSELLANYAVLEAMKLLSDEFAATTVGKLLTLQLDTMVGQLHPVLKIPRCPHCSEFTEPCPERIWG
jgi:bacteriocin biosynthesis cyclodehydratase domain-containing protein